MQAKRNNFGFNSQLFLASVSHGHMRVCPFSREVSSFCSNCEHARDERDGKRIVENNFYNFFTFNETSAFLTLSRSAKYLTMAIFASPSTGGALI